MIDLTPWEDPQWTTCAWTRYRAFAEKIDLLMWAITRGSP